jgi:hypothetical protein
MANVGSIFELTMKAFLELERVLYFLHVSDTGPFLQPQIHTLLRNQHQNNMYKISSFRKVLRICISNTADVASQEPDFISKTTRTPA